MAAADQANGRQAGRVCVLRLGMRTLAALLAGALLVRARPFPHRARHAAHRRHRRHPRRHRRIHHHPEDHRTDRRRRPLDRRPRATDPDRRLHRPRRGHARGARPADGPRAAGQGCRAARALALLGNHEVMNLIGDTRDVTREIFATFADAKSEARREEAWAQYEALAQGAHRQGPVDAAGLRADPRGVAHHASGRATSNTARRSRPRGKYGAWLRDKDIVTLYGGSIFMHAGIAPETAPAKLDELNDRVRAEVRRLDQFAANGWSTRNWRCLSSRCRRSCRWRRMRSARPTR